MRHWLNAIPSRSSELSSPPSNESFPAFVVILASWQARMIDMDIPSQVQSTFYGALAWQDPAKTEAWGNHSWARWTCQIFTVIAMSLDSRPICLEGRDNKWLQWVTDVGRQWVCLSVKSASLPVFLLVLAQIRLGAKPCGKVAISGGCFLHKTKFFCTVLFLNVTIASIHSRHLATNLGSVQTEPRLSEDVSARRRVSVLWEVIGHGHEHIPRTLEGDVGSDQVL